MTTIRSEDLRLTDIPSGTAAMRDLSAFAYTFDGYAHWGSFDRCADIANSRNHESLDNLRTCLFFEARRWHHYAEDPDLEAELYWRDLVTQIRRKVRN